MSQGGNYGLNDEDTRAHVENKARHEVEAYWAGIQIQNMFKKFPIIKTQAAACRSFIHHVFMTTIICYFYCSNIVSRLAV